MSYSSEREQTNDLVTVGIARSLERLQNDEKDLVVEVISSTVAECSEELGIDIGRIKLMENEELFGEDALRMVTSVMDENENVVPVIVLSKQGISALAKSLSYPSILREIVQDGVREDLAHEMQHVADIINGNYDPDNVSSNINIKTPWGALKYLGHPNEKRAIEYARNYMLRRNQSKVSRLTGIITRTPNMMMSKVVRRLSQ